MPATEIPSRSPIVPPPRPDGSDLYDAERWESAYRDIHDVPALLLQLQDDLSRSRKREAFWMSLVVHLALVLLIINSPKFERFFPKRTFVVTPNDWMRQKELTYLQLPPDAQKVTKRPDTNIISDKDRIATSRSPHLDPKELRKILDSSAPGTPGPSGPPQAQEPQPPPPQPAQAEAKPAPAKQSTPAAPPKLQTDQNQIARLQTPPLGVRPSFNTGPMTAGSAIEQAARAAMANRGNYGDEGDYGLGLGRQPSEAIGPLDVLSDTMGVNFGPYLARVLHDVKRNWYNLIPEAARAPLMKKGKVSIEFAILKDGRVAGMQLAGSSGDVALDRAAWGGITGSNPFPPLPSEFGGQYLALRFHFYYNLDPDKSDLR
jgi:TonB family protein